MSVVFISVNCFRQLSAHEYSGISVNCRHFRLGYALPSTGRPLFDTQGKTDREGMATVNMRALKMSGDA